MAWWGKIANVMEEVERVKDSWMSDSPFGERERRESRTNRKSSLDVLSPAKENTQLPPHPPELPGPSTEDEIEAKNPSDSSPLRQTPETSQIPKLSRLDISSPGKENPQSPPSLPGAPGPNTESRPGFDDSCQTRALTRELETVLARIEKDYDQVGEQEWRRRYEIEMAEHLKKFPADSKEYRALAIDVECLRMEPRELVLEMAKNGLSTSGPFRILAFRYASSRIMTEVGPELATWNESDFIAWCETVVPDTYQYQTHTNPATSVPQTRPYPTGQINPSDTYQYQTQTYPIAQSIPPDTYYYEPPAIPVSPIHQTQTYPITRDNPADTYQYNSPARPVTTILENRVPEIAQVIYPAVYDTSCNVVNTISEIRPADSPPNTVPCVPRLPNGDVHIDTHSNVDSDGNRNRDNNSENNTHSNSDCNRNRDNDSDNYTHSNLDKNGYSDVNNNTDVSPCNKSEKCRVCLGIGMPMKDLYGVDDGVPLSTVAMSIAKVRMSPEDGLTALVCCMCAEMLRCAYKVKLQVEHADKALRGERGAVRKEKLTPPRTRRTKTTPRHNRPTPSHRQKIPPQKRAIPSLLDTPCAVPISQKTPKKIPALMELHISNPLATNTNSAIPKSPECRSSPSPPRSPRTPTMRHNTEHRAPRHSSSPTVVVGKQLRGDGACWRCGRHGHTHRECRAPKRWAYCYLCGERHVRIDTCPQCSASWWKARQEQSFGYPSGFSKKDEGRQDLERQGRQRYDEQYERRQSSGQNGRRRYNDGTYGRCQGPLYYGTDFTNRRAY